MTAGILPEAADRAGGAANARPHALASPRADVILGTDFRGAARPEGPFEGFIGNDRGSDLPDRHWRRSPAMTASRAAPLPPVPKPLRRLPPPLCCLLCCLAILAPTPAPSAVPAPSLRDAIEAAWARLPQRRIYAAQGDLARAHALAGSSLFPDAPYSAGEYDDDRAGSNEGFRTTRIELGTPVWLPGEGTQSEHVAVAEALTAKAAGDAAHLAVGLRVLDLAEQARLADDEREVACARLAQDRALARSVADRLRVGESARADRLAADASVSFDEISVDEADRRLGEARAALSELTGDDALPDLAPAGPALGVAAGRAEVSPQVIPVDTHPRVIAARRALEQAQAHARLVWIEDRASPQIGLQVTNDKQFGSPWDTRAGVVFRLPFASRARNAPLRAAAEEAVARAETALELARRAVEAAIRAALVAQAASGRASLAADRAAGALTERNREIRQAWLLGEMPLIEVTRAQTAAFDAVLARARAHSRLQAATDRVTLASGSLP